MDRNQEATPLRCASSNSCAALAPIGHFAFTTKTSFSPVQRSDMGRPVALVFALLCCKAVCQQYSPHDTTEASDGADGGGESLSVDELAGYGMLDEEATIEEVQRLAALELTEAVQAIISGTNALAASQTPDELQEYVLSFEQGMRGEEFMGVEDSGHAVNARYRRALFIAACRTLATQAAEQGQVEW